jgi:molybdenum cofactor guanylyltransferase
MEKTNIRVAGIVLAGGQSLRMGQDKATLTLDNQSLLSRAIALLTDTGVTQCFVSGQYEGVECIADQEVGLGPIAGIAACATALSDDYDAMLIIPIDMPLLAEQDCTYLLRLFQEHDQENHSLYSSGLYYRDTIFPMLIALTSPLLNYLNEIIDIEDKKARSLYRLFETLDIKGIKSNQIDATRFENTNTPQQWQHCLNTFATMQQIDKN